MNPEDDYKVKRNSRKAEVTLARCLLQPNEGYAFGGRKEYWPNSFGTYIYTSRMVEQTNITWNEAEEILKEWTKSGWYGYGQTLKTGWFTDKGRKELYALTR